MPDRICAAGRFIRGKTGTNVCPPGSVVLKTVPECKRAAEAMLLSYGDQANTQDHPKGCYVSGGASGRAVAVYFNFDARGSACRISEPICRDLSTPSPTLDGQTMVPTVAPSSAAVASSNFWLVGNGTCISKRYSRCYTNFQYCRVTSRVKLVADEAACADACEVLECEGYAYVHSGKYAQSCWVYGEKLEEGLPRQYASGELATTEWQGRPGRGGLDNEGDSTPEWIIKDSSRADASRCMLRGTDIRI